METCDNCLEEKETELKGEMRLCYDCQEAIINQNEDDNTKFDASLRN